MPRPRLSAGSISQSPSCSGRFAPANERGGRHGCRGPTTARRHRARCGAPGPDGRSASRPGGRAARGRTGRRAGPRANPPSADPPRSSHRAGARRSLRRRGGPRTGPARGPRSATTWQTRSKRAGGTGPDPSPSRRWPVGKSGGGGLLQGAGASASCTTTPVATLGWRNASIHSGSLMSTPMGSRPWARTCSRAAAREGTLNVRWWGPGPRVARKRSRKSFDPVSLGMSISRRAPLAKRSWPGANPDERPPESHCAPRSTA